jgi:4-oxalocrotonate tautomerase family enzyme
MPTVIIEGPPLAIRRKRRLAAALTQLVAQAYDWPKANIILILHENPDRNIARGGRLLSDRKKNLSSH